MRSEAFPARISSIPSDLNRFLSTTEYNATLTDGTRIKVTHPFLDIYGNEYMVASQYMRIGQLYLQCINDAEHRIVTVPASFTDYGLLNSNNSFKPAKESYYTVNALTEANNILIDALKVSTD